jgi:hypothetical protein
MSHDTLQDQIDNLTDEACSLDAQHRVRAMAHEIGINGAFIVADMIDRTCPHTGNRYIALMADSDCGLKDWHAFAKELRGPWETYG